jgi:hypothetical protein
MELARARNLTMPWTQAGAAAVVVAQQFNPSVVSQIWLRDNHILAVDEFLDGSIYTDFVVQVRSRPFHMLVLQDQLQFVPAAEVPVVEQQQVIVEKLGAIIDLLPHTPYRALGLNFSWHLTPAADDIGAFSRRLFSRDDQPLYQQFREENAHFGAYLSKEVAGFRLRLDIKPIVVATERGPENRLQFGFNFHRDIGEGGARLIVEGLDHWDEVRQETERIIDSVEARNP